MENQLVNAVYAERKHTYHILTAIMNMAHSEVFISKKFKQFIIDAQKESECDYLKISDEMHEQMYEQEFRKENG